MWGGRRQGMSAEQAAAVLGEVKRSQREGGPVSLAEMRAEAERERQAAAAARVRQEAAEAELARVPRDIRGSGRAVHAMGPAAQKELGV